MPQIPQIETYSMPTLSEFPKNIANWKINSERAVILVHDMQKFFVGKIPSSDLKTQLLQNMILIRDYAVKHKIPLAYTCQTGDMTDQQRGLLKCFWGGGMKAEPTDREVVDELKPSPQDWLLTKWRYSAFHNSGLLQKLIDAGRDQIIICGVYAHIGILITAVESFSHDIETFIVGDAVAGFSHKSHMMALDYAAQCCAVVVSTRDLLL